MGRILHRFCTALPPRSGFGAVWRSVQFQFELVHVRIAGAQVLRHFGGSGGLPDKKLCILSVKARSGASRLRRPVSAGIRGHCTASDGLGGAGWTVAQLLKITITGSSQGA